MVFFLYFSFLIANSKHALFIHKYNPFFPLFNFFNFCNPETKIDPPENKLDRENHNDKTKIVVILDLRFILQVSVSALPRLISKS